MLPGVISVFIFVLVHMATAEDPIIHLTPVCPTQISGIPSLLLTVDVPAHGIARCKNGNKVFASQNDVEHRLVGSFDQAYRGDDCGYYKKNGSNTFVVDVEVGWGEKNREVISHTEIHTVSCAYDDHGNALTATETISDGFIAPQEQQHLMGNLHNSSSFVLQVVDVFGREAEWSAIEIGRKIRLKAMDTSKTVKGFRALSCVVRNGLTSYAILRAGCGDGLVFEKTAGFYTQDSEVLSPYFDAFKLRDLDTVRFECNFTVCSSRCDGDSCVVESRRRRTLAEAGQGSEQIVKTANDASPLLSLVSKPIRTKLVMAEEPPKMKTEVKGETDYLMHLGTLVRDYPPHPKSTVLRTRSEMVGFHLIAFIITLAGFVFVSFIWSLYMCCMYRADFSPSASKDNI